MKNKVVILTVFILIIVVILGVFRTNIFNKQLVDFTFSYDKCITTVGNKVYEIEIDSWKDYTDGEQLQIKGKDGKIYLVSANNSILIKEKK